MMVGNADDAKRFGEMGATTFIVASDQTFMRQAATVSYTHLTLPTSDLV